VLKSYELLYPG